MLVHLLEGHGYWGDGILGTLTKRIKRTKGGGAKRGVKEIEMVEALSLKQPNTALGRKGTCQCQTVCFYFHLEFQDMKNFLGNSR